VSDSESLKLTTWFGERDRTGGRLVGDALLDCYGERRVQASILLRGAEGFGHRHGLRTDQLLSLSEDLPVVTIAVDRRERIEQLRDAVAPLLPSGLLTLERARLLTGEIAGARLPEDLDEQTKLTVYLGRHERTGRVPGHVAVCALLYAHGLAGAAVLLGVDGTREGVRSRAVLLGRNAGVPTMVVAVGDGGQIAGVLPELGRLLRRPVVTLERVRICKRDGHRLRPPRAEPATGAEGLAMWQKLSVYTSQSATIEGRPLNLELIRRLRAAGAAGATSLRGIWGFHGRRPPHGDRLLQIRRHVPVLTVTIDTPARTARAWEIIDELTAEEGLVTSELVPAAAIRPS
jgi:PII-like signaling protein